MKIYHLTASLLMLLPMSCAKDSADKKPSANAAPTGAKIRSIYDWADEHGKDKGYAQDENGKWVPRSNKRSSFESKGDSPYFKGEYGKKAYKTGEYAKKSWWGNKDYGHQEYAGNTDGTRFQKNSRFDGQGAREAGTSADIPGPYQTGTYATGDAREAGTDRLAKPQNAEIENRREVYQAPEIIDWREQRKITMDQMKGILGH